MRILRLNDYDFGEGTVPLVTYTDLPQFIYGVASTATKTFPTNQNEPFNFLNLDLYAQDTWKVTLQAYMDGRYPRHVQFQSAEPARRKLRVFEAHSIRSRTMSISRSTLRFRRTLEICSHPLRWRSCNQGQRLRGSSNRKPC